MGRVPPTGDLCQCPQPPRHHHILSDWDRSRNHEPISRAQPWHQSHRLSDQLTSGLDKCQVYRQAAVTWPHLSITDQTQTVENVRIAQSLVSPQPVICCLMTERPSQSWRPVRIITSSSSKIFRDLSILLTLIPGNSSQLVKILLYQRLSLDGKDAACEISSHLDLSQVITDGHTHTAHWALLD